MSSAPQPVKVQYFRQSGKYYADGETFVGKVEMFEIHTYIRYLQEIRNLPGLREGCGADLFILVTAPGHPQDHPRLISPLIQE